MRIRLTDEHLKGRMRIATTEIKPANERGPFSNNLVIVNAACERTEVSQVSETTYSCTLTETVAGRFVS
jgi:hypothetical protein